MGPQPPDPHGAGPRAGPGHRLEQVHHCHHGGAAGGQGGCDLQRQQPRRYVPTIPREQAALQETESLLRRVYRGSVGLMVSTLADGRGLTADDIDELSAILEKAKEAQL